MIAFEDLRRSEAVATYIQKADDSLSALGYTEHSFSHVTKAASMAGSILETLGYPKREAELARIAGYLHDIGNIVNRVDHAQSGAVMAFRILDKMGMDPGEIADVISAIGNHDEGTAMPVNPVAAALILADKTDVRRSRVRNRDFLLFYAIFPINARRRMAFLFAAVRWSRSGVSRAISRRAPLPHHRPDHGRSGRQPGRRTENSPDEIHHPTAKGRPAHEYAQKKR